METSELQIIADELAADPLSLGLTILPEDDEANANILNEVRDSILIYRASVPSDQINIPIDEFNGASAGQREWWAMQTADGSIAPSVIATEFYKMFGAGTAARASFDAVAKEPASRARQLLNRYVHLVPSDISAARPLI